MRCVAKNEDIGLKADLTLAQNSTKDLSAARHSLTETTRMEGQDPRIDGAKSHQGESRQLSTFQLSHKVRASGIVLAEAIKTSDSTRERPRFAWRKSAAVAQSPQSHRGQAGSSRRKVRASGIVLAEAIKSLDSIRPSPTRGKRRQVSLQVPRVVGATSRQVSHKSARAAKDDSCRTQVLSSPRPKVGRQLPAQKARVLSGKVLAEAPKSLGSTRHPGDRTINTHNK